MKKLIFIIFIGILTGCSTLGPQSSGNNGANNSLGIHYLPRPARQNQLSNLQNRSARGSIAIHTEQKGWNASFNWQQQNGHYVITLFGPLGTNRVQLTGDPLQVTLQTANRLVSAPTPESLIQQQLGWNLPISNLYYWLRGLPAPHARSRQSYDINNHLVHLTQQGWNIIYLRYSGVNGIDLPNRLLLNNPALQIRIVISQWDV